MRVFLRLIGFASLLATGLLVAALAALFIHDPIGLQRFRASWTHVLSPWLLGVIGIKKSVIQRASPPFTDGAPGMTVSNHISYVDILLIASEVPAVFVTSTEVRDSPGLGLICRLAGCAFVDRRSAGGLRREIGALATLMRHGLHVVVFPEATSTRGEGVLPFKGALFEAVRQADAPLWMVRIDYAGIHRPIVSYAGDDEFGAHLLRLLSLESVAGILSWVHRESEVGLRTARELAELSRERILTA